MDSSIKVGTVEQSKIDTCNDPAIERQTAKQHYSAILVKKFSFIEKNRLLRFLYLLWFADSEQSKTYLSHIVFLSIQQNSFWHIVQSRDYM